MRQVEEALARQVIYGGDLVTNLLEVARVDEVVLTGLLAESMRLAPAPAGELPRASDEVRSLVPREIALQRTVVPLEVQADGKLVLAVAEPLPADLAEQLRFALGMSPRTARCAGGSRASGSGARLWRPARPAHASPHRAPRREHTGGWLDPSTAGGRAGGPRAAASAERSAPTIRQRTGPPAAVVGRLAARLPGHRITNAGFPAAPAPVASATPAAPLEPVEAAAPPDPAPEPALALAAAPSPAGSERLAASVASPPAVSPAPVVAAAPASSASPAPAPSPAPPGPGEVRAGLLQRAVSVSPRPLRRRRGPITVDAARSEAEEAADRDALLDLFFDFSQQFFDYSALFLVHGDIAEGPRRVRRRRIARASPRHRRSARHAEHDVERPREAPLGRREGAAGRARRGPARGPAAGPRLRDGDRPAGRAHARRGDPDRRLRRRGHRSRERAAGRVVFVRSSARRSSASSFAASSTASSPGGATAASGACRRRWSRRNPRRAPQGRRRRRWPVAPRPLRRLPSRGRRARPRPWRRHPPRPPPRRSPPAAAPVRGPRALRPQARRSVAGALGRDLRPSAARRERGGGPEDQRPADSTRRARDARGRARRHPDFAAAAQGRRRRRCRRRRARRRSSRSSSSTTRRRGRRARSLRRARVGGQAGRGRRAPAVRRRGRGRRTGRPLPSPPRRSCRRSSSTISIPISWRWSTAWPPARSTRLPRASSFARASARCAPSCRDSPAPWPSRAPASRRRSARRAPATAARSCGSSPVSAVSRSRSCSSA